MVEKTKDLNNEKEQEVEDLRKYVQALTSFLPLAFCMVDGKDSILEINQAFEEITGYKKEEAVGKHVNFLFENKGKAESFIVRAANKSSTVEEEMNLLTKRGKELPVKVSALAREDAKGDFCGYFLTFADITETKRFEEELERRIRERTQELEKAKEKLEESEAILEKKVKERTQELKELNEKLEEKVKERTEEIRKKAKEVEEKARETKKVQRAVLNIAEDNEKALREARREKKKTSAIVKNFVDGLLLFDAEKKLTMINPKAEELLEVNSKEVLKKGTKELKDFPNFKILVEDIVGEEIEEAFRKEMQLEGETCYEITTLPIKQDGKEVGTLVTIHDITREKGIERIKSEFVSVAAHQLRTPLAGIKWMLQGILEEEEELGVPKEIMGFIKKAYSANDRMVRLVNDLLNVTRIEEGRYAYKPEKADIKEIIEPFKDTYKEKIEEGGKVKFKVREKDEEIPKVEVDKEKVGLVVQNFVENAMKYTEEGEIVLSLEYLEEEGKIKVSISDTGMGIPEEQQERMFSKFFRASNVQRKDTEGSGLGLFIAKNIIEAHKGEVGFTSKEGEGTIFYFTLPVIKEEE